MILDGWDRRPRLAPPTPDDVAAIWLRLSVRQREVVRDAAAERGTTPEQLIRARIEHVQGLLRVRPTARA